MSSFKDIVYGNNKIGRDWKNWIKTNYLRNCGITDILSILHSHGFSKFEIDAAIRELWNESPMEGGYDINAAWFPNEPYSHDYEIVTLSKYPIIKIFKNILTSEECEQLIASGKNFKRARTMGATENAVHDHRTNDLTVLDTSSSPLVAELEDRIEEITGIPKENGETLQLLRYAKMQEYKPHQDFFSDTPNGNKSMELGGQRIATVITYLSDVESGGETIFPDITITVKPKAGDALYFEYCDRNGGITDHTRHGSKPVISGTKYAVTKWLRHSTWK